MVKISKRKMIKCGCGKVYKTRQTLYVHVKNYHKGINPKNMKKCGCGKVYKTRQTLYVHIKNYHRGITPINTIINRAGRPRKDIK